MRGFSRDRLTRGLTGDAISSRGPGRLLFGHQRAVSLSAGDPGFFSFLGRAIGTVGRQVLGLPAAPASTDAITRGAAPPVAGPGTGHRAPSRAPTATGISGHAAALGQLGLAGGFARRRHRRLRVTNVRALRRAMRRVQGFAHLASKTIAFTHRVRMRRARGRGFFGRRRRVA